MPSVDVAMARSLRGGVWGSLADSIAASLTKRDTIADLQGKASEAKNAFTNWDSCMQVNYCKWPVIAMIVIGGLILLSIITCIVRCACCGLSCCCSCCYCLKCCGNCCGMCDTPRGTPHKHLDNQYALPSNQGYRTVPPMKAPSPFASSALPSSDPPQYAEFDVSRKGGEDALPAMPSWEGSGSKKVMVDGGEVEMDQLKKPEASQGAPLMAGAGSSQSSPGMPMDNRSPYGQPSPNGYLAPSQRSDPYGANQGYGQGGYGQDVMSPPADQYGAAATGPGRHSPGFGGYHDQGYQRSHSPQVYGDYAHNPQTQGYGSQRRPSPPRNGAYAGHSPTRHGDYGYDQQQGQYSNGDYGHYPPQPQRQYSSDSTRPLAAASPNIQNNSGFDFNSGYSRPQQQAYGQRQGSPPRQQYNGGDGYQAYQPYQRQQNGW